MWAIWCARNDLIFEKKQVISFMQAIFRKAYWLRFWSLLEHEVSREIVFGKQSVRGHPFEYLRQQWMKK